MRELFVEAWRREIAFQRQVVPIPVWRVALGIAFGGAAGVVDHGPTYWLLLVAAWFITLGPWALREALGKNRPVERRRNDV